jgi:formate dehydrogenase major subunit
MSALTRTPRPSPKTGSYDLSSWQYEALTEAAGQAAERCRSAAPDRSIRDHEQPALLATGGRGATLEHVELQRDATLQHPSCVFQILKRHFARYTRQWSPRPAEDRKTSSGASARP